MTFKKNRPSWPHPWDPLHSPLPVVECFPNTKRRSAAFWIPCDTSNQPYASPPLSLIVVFSMFPISSMTSLPVHVRHSISKPLSSLAINIEVASRIQIHRDFLSPAALRERRAEGSARTLYYYVSGERMRQVVDACQRTHGIPRAPNRLCWYLY